jgi:tetratricopeptide (TPR) repeat protein
MNGPSMNAGAEEKFNKGMEFYRKYTRDDNETAQALFEDVVNATEPTPTAPAPNRLAARACAGLAATYRQAWNFEWNITPTDGLHNKEQQAMYWANKSVDLDASLPDGHVQLAYLYLYQKKWDEAEREADLAVQRGGADYADGYAVLAQVLTYRGRPQRAVPLMDQALALEPQAPVSYRRQLGQAYYVWGQVEKYLNENDQEAVKNYRKARLELERALNHRQARLTLAAVYMESGEEPKAKALFTLDPDMRRHVTIGQRRQQAPYENPMLRVLYIEALRRAGL